MAKFEAETYLQYRIFYPQKLFEPLRSHRGAAGMSTPTYRVLDLGAGTGFASHSYLNCFPKSSLVLVEPDPKMLEKAEALLSSHLPKVESCLASGEDFSLPQQVDLVLVGSAWHWMHFEKTVSALLKALRPGGLISIFEYQFPKAMGRETQALTEWIRREFNLKWKPTHQTPRGSLEELTEPLRSHEAFSQKLAFDLSEETLLSIDDLMGIIVSQSRYLDYERIYHPNETERELSRQNLRKEIMQYWGSHERIPFLYRFQCFVFQRRFI